MIRLLVAVYLIEAGLVLTISPWTLFWEHNYFAHAWPWAGALMASPFVRGGVTGIGLITAAAGLRDLAAKIFERSAPAGDPPTDGPPSP